MRAFEEAADDLRARAARFAVDLGCPLIETQLEWAGYDLDEIDEIRGQVDIFHYLDAKLLMEGLQKIANRIATGLILAALIIGASLLMRVDTPFRIFGYPGLAMLLFLAAAAGGFWLVLGTYIQDRRSAKKAAR